MKALLILATVLTVVVIATTNSHFAERSAENEKVPHAIPRAFISSSARQSDEAGVEVKLVLLALAPDGFDTREMQLDPGDYLFIIGNRTGLKEVNVRLDREGRERIAAATVGGRRRDWKQRFKLTPGNYLVTADDNPDWTCRIVVGR